MEKNDTDSERRVKTARQDQDWNYWSRQQFRSLRHVLTFSRSGPCPGGLALPAHGAGGATRRLHRKLVGGDGHEEPVPVMEDDMTGRDLQLIRHPVARRPPGARPVLRRLSMRARECIRMTRHGCPACRSAGRCHRSPAWPRIPAGSNGDHHRDTPASAVKPGGRYAAARSRSCPPQAPRFAPARHACGGAADLPARSCAHGPRRGWSRCRRGYGHRRGPGRSSSAAAHGGRRGIAEEAGHGDVGHRYPGIPAASRIREAAPNSRITFIHPESGFMRPVLQGMTHCTGTGWEYGDIFLTDGRHSPHIQGRRGFRIGGERQGAAGPGTENIAPHPGSRIRSKAWNQGGPELELLSAEARPVKRYHEPCPNSRLRLIRFGGMPGHPDMVARGTLSTTPCLRKGDRKCRST